MVVLFDVGPLADQPFTDSDESDEQHNKADYRAYCEHQRHSIRLPSLRSAVITRCGASDEQQPQSSEFVRSGRKRLGDVPPVQGRARSSRGLGAAGGPYVIV